MRRKWLTVPIHLCEHHLYVNAKKHLREDGQEGWGITYRTLLAEPTLMETGAWVRHWDEQMTEQTARRASMPPHYSSALDPHTAAVRQQLERRRRTFRKPAPDERPPRRGPAPRQPP